MTVADPALCSGAGPEGQWRESLRIAQGWLDVVRLAERERRKDAGEPLLKLEKVAVS